MVDHRSYAEEIKKGIEESDLEFEGVNREFERLWLEGFGSLSEGIDELPTSEQKFSDDEKFFFLMMEQAKQGLYDMYLSLRRRRYTAARRDLRYVYEALLLLDKSVADSEWASEIQQSLREEAGEINFPIKNVNISAPKTTSKISNKASKLHNDLKDEEEAMGKFKQLLGVSGSHPYNFQSMDRNSKKNLQSEFPYLKYGVNFSYGLMWLFVMKFNGEKISDEKFREMMDIMREQLRLNDEEMYLFIHYFSDFREEIDEFNN
jgi:hypothetical protein